jgi:hypothetical protein
MKKFLTLLGIAFTIQNYAISPCYFRLEAKSKVDGSIIAVSNTVYDTNPQYYTDNLQSPNNNGLYGRLYTPKDNFIYFDVWGSFVSMPTKINLEGKISPYEIAHNAYDLWDTFGLTNVVISWSEDAGMFSRVHNKTRYPVTVNDAAGNTHNICSGSGVCISTPEMLNINVDTSSYEEATTITISNIDTGLKRTGTSLTTSFPDNYGRLVVEEMPDMPIGNVPIFSSLGNILHGKTNSVLYAEFLKELSSTNYQVFTEWAFNDKYIPNTPKAFINNKCVCESHTAGHIIPHDISDKNPILHWNPETRSFNWDFSMSLQLNPSDNVYDPNESCTFRCWVGADKYDDAKVKAQVEGTMSTIANFKIVYSPITGEWTISAL